MHPNMNIKSIERGGTFQGMSSRAEIGPDIRPRVGNGVLDSKSETLFDAPKPGHPITSPNRFGHPVDFSKLQIISTPTFLINSRHGLVCQTVPNQDKEQSRLLVRSHFPIKMDYDFRNRANPPYDSQIPTYRPTATSSSASHPMYGSSLYPKVAQAGHSVNPSGGGRASSFHHISPSSTSSSGLGIRVVIKPEYRITPPPQLSTQIGDIPRSTYQFDFDLERKILAEAEKESQNWSRLGLENLPSKPAESSSSMGSTTDPVVSKYIASGLSREAVPLAVANYGDNPTRVKEFVNGFTLLREMGFSSNNVAEALVMYDNDTDKAIAHFLNSSS